MPLVLNTCPPPPLLVCAAHQLRQGCIPEVKLRRRSGGLVLFDSNWAELVERLRCRSRYTCFFADGHKQEEARKALESALGEKKAEFEKWDKELKKREEMASGGGSGRGGWLGGGGWFGWFNEEHFWGEAQQALIAVVGIVFLYLLLAKGNVMFAVVFNSLLFALRGVRNWFTYASSQLSGANYKSAPSGRLSSSPLPNETYQTQLSAKERVIRKWRTD